MPDNTAQNIEEEIKKLEQIFLGLSCYITNKGIIEIVNEDKEANTLYESFGSRAFDRERRTIDEKMQTLAELEGIFADFKRVLLRLGVSSEEMTDEKMKAYFEVEKEIALPVIDAEEDEEKKSPKLDGPKMN